jgi:hypothetical protein
MGRTKRPRGMPMIFPSLETGSPRSSVMRGVAGTSQPSKGVRAALLA